MEALDDAALALLLDGGANGWGQALRTTLGGHRLFVKAVPVTDRERRSNLTTANLYDLPPYLNYPFGSPGIGVGRELAFARTSSGWVESGAALGFPMLLHDRVIDRGLITGDAGSSGGYTAYRGDNAAMNTYLADRTSARSCLILIYEDVGAAAVDWLVEHPADAPWILDDVRSTLKFLRQRDVVHFDIDLFNVITDGRQAYIADHGLRSTVRSN